MGLNHLRVLLFIALVSAIGCSKFRGAIANMTSSQMGAATPTGPAVIPKDGDFPKIPSNFNVNDFIVGKVGEFPTQTALPDVVGAFRFGCLPSHNASDDPIVYPGKPGASHLHTFFGNTKVNAHSTYESLRTTGESTCDGGPINRSAYWVPAMLNGKGQVVMPDFTIVYYKATPKSTRLPRGLRMVFGYDFATKVQRHYWYCDHKDAGEHKSTIAEVNCPAGSHLLGVTGAPNCWNGKDLDSIDHRSHMAYASGGKCPETHPVELPAFTLLLFYSHNGPSDIASWHLSSDRMAGMTDFAGGSTLHGDWFGAWDDDVMEVWMSHCIDNLLSCSSGTLGDGRMLKSAKTLGLPPVSPLQPVPVSKATSHDHHSHMGH